MEWLPEIMPSLLARADGYKSIVRRLADSVDPTDPQYQILGEGEDEEVIILEFEPSQEVNQCADFWMLMEPSPQFPQLSRNLRLIRWAD